MKIGIITYWSSDDNYGQLLQCFALQRYLKRKGHDAYLIKYSPSYRERGLTRKLKKLLSWKFIYSLFSGQYLKDKAVAKQEECLRAKNVVLNQRREFEKFRELYINSTDIVYKNIQQLRENPPQADVYICGSDQVWNNPLSHPNTAAWYLSFGKDTVKRIAYAASIGRIFKKSELQPFKSYLRGFDRVGVREESVLKLCRQLGVNNAQITLDPTLLLPADDYKEIASIPTDSDTPYMFIYVLNIYDKDEIYWKHINEYLSVSDMGVKIVCSSGYVQARELIDDHPNQLATIPEWLGYIENAECVMTTSFHGVVFCIKMHKRFLAVYLTNQFRGGNDRISSLLHSIGLESRIYNPNVSLSEQMEREIDWVEVEQKLSTLQVSSYEFLDSLQ